MGFSHLEKAERFEESMLLLTLKMQEAMAQGMQAASRIQKRRGDVFSPRASRINAILLSP